MPARKRKKKGNKYLLIVIILLVSLYIAFAIKHWDGTKLLVAKSLPDSVSIISYDPVNETITTVFIPAETQVEVAGGYGVWRLGSVGQLGRNEKVDKLLTSTLQKYFGIPVYLTFEDLSLLDRAALKLFTLSTPDLSKKDINLSDYVTLTKQILKDGKEGYVLTRNLPDSIMLIFSDPALSDAKANIALINASGIDLNDNVGKAVETMGAKISISNSVQQEDFDCEVLGQGEVAIKLARVFGCKYTKNSESNFDATIKLGAQFGKRF